MWNQLPAAGKQKARSIFTIQTDLYVYVLVHSQGKKE